MPWILRMLAIALAVVVSIAGSSTAIAMTQGESNNAFADLELPEIAVTITDTAIEGAPAELAAGRYLLTVTNDTDEESLGAGFLQPPPDMTAGQFVDFIASMAPSDVASTEATPADEEMSGPPAFFYEVPIAGGIYAAAGSSASMVLDLTAGEWVLWAEDPAAPQPPVAIVVTGEAPSNPAEPVADVTITGQEMSFEIEGELTTGQHIIEFVNAGEQPHFLLMLKVPDGTSVDDFLGLSATFGDPAASPTAGLSFEDISTVLDTADQSGGVTTWTTVDMEAGTYIIACFVPDIETGAPHAMLGMIDVITVP